MSTEGLRIMVDANVWVDNYCADHVGSTAAKRFLQVARAQGAELLYPFHCIKDVQYVIAHEFKRAARRERGPVSEETARAIREVSWGCVRNMSELATAVGGDISDVWLALKYLKINPDLEDNFVLSACRRADADYLVTSDKALIEAADVVAKTPEQMIALLELKG